MKTGGKILTSATTAIIWLSSWASAMAARPPIVPEGTAQQLNIPTAPEGIPEETYLRGAYLPELTKTVISAAGVAAVLFIIIGGIQILTAYGNDEKIGKGKKTVTYAIVGLLIAILSYAIVSIISVISI